MVLGELREYLRNEGLSQEEIFNLSAREASIAGFLPADSLKENDLIASQAHQAYNADPAAFSDPRPLHSNYVAQNIVQHAANATENPLRSNNPTSTITGISSNNSLDTQHDFHQNKPYDSGMVYSQTTQHSAAFNPSTPNHHASHLDSLPYTNNQNQAFGAASSSIDHAPIRMNPSMSQHNNMSRTEKASRAGVPRHIRSGPTAMQKSTGRAVHASTLHFNTLVMDEHLQIDDELHVPLAAIIRADGSRHLARGEVAVMKV